MMTMSIVSPCLTQMQTPVSMIQTVEDGLDISVSRFESLFCQFGPGCSVGEWQLPNSITNYQQHFTITRGNTGSTGNTHP